MCWALDLSIIIYKKYDNWKNILYLKKISSTMWIIFKKFSKKLRTNQIIRWENCSCNLELV